VELKALICFHRVALRGSLRQAARELGTTQPTLSHHIARLESEWGFRLLDRSQRPIRLTPAGELLLPRVRALIAEVNSIQAELPKLRAQSRPELKVGATSAISSLMPAVLAQFVRAQPEVSLTLREGLSSDLAHLVKSGELDLALVFSAAARAMGYRLRTEALFSVDFAFVVSPHHALAGRDELRLCDLDQESLILSGGISGEILLRALDESHVRPARVYETNDGATSLELVAQGMGVGFTSELRLQQARNTLRVLPSGDRQFSRMVNVVWLRRQAAPTAVEFLEIVRHYTWPLG